MTWRLRGVLLALPLVFLTALEGGAQTNAEIDAGIRAYTEQGNPREAIRLIGGALDVGNVSGSTRARAQMYLAHAFLALADTVSALPHIEGALAAFPCLLPAPDLAPPDWIALYERARPPDAECQPRMLTATVRSMLIPGWGQRTLGRSAASNYFFGTTVASLAGAVFLHTRAGQRYDAYQSSTDFLEVASLYNQAERARKSALVIGGAATALYLWNVVDSALSAAAHDRRLADVRPLAVLPLDGAGDAGVLIVLQIAVK
jgi:hypothetical protein